MNNEQLLAKIRELNPECTVTFPPDMSERTQRLFLLFIAKFQYNGASMYTKCDVKNCKYMGKPFYRISHTFRAWGNDHVHFYPFVNVDAITFDMYHAAGKVPRANLERMDYVCLGHHWRERGDANPVEFDAFVARHNLI